MSRIKKMRELIGKTQAELAAEIGVDRTTVAKWETGVSMPRIALLPKLARALGCGITELLEDETEGGKNA